MSFEKYFEKSGGKFCIPLEEFQNRMKGIKAIIFDWDGVFNNGVKDHQASSNYNEVDAMGTNLLRFSRWLNGQMPIVAVMSGEKNELCFHLTRREHFQAVYYKVNNKQLAFDHFLEKYSLKENEVAFIYDDVLDLAIARRCGIRILVGHQGNPLFRNYVMNRNLADYITGQDQYAVRESCELMIACTGNFDEVLDERSGFSSVYFKYLEERQQIATEFFSLMEGKIINE